MIILHTKFEYISRLVVLYLRKYKKKQIPKNKVILQFPSDDDFEIKSKIYSFNCLSCFYSYLELQDDFSVIFIRCKFTRDN